FTVYPRHTFKKRLIGTREIIEQEHAHSLINM
ncbi:MAG: hypothetical protein ACI9ES_002856, partial [Oceanospirillaceae bacterium]